MLAYKKYGKNKQPNKKSDHFVGDYYVLYNKKLKDHPELEQAIRDAPKIWEAGTPADQSGDIVFEAIKNNVFYIFTEIGESWEIGMKNRFDNIWRDYDKTKTIIKNL